MKTTTVCGMLLAGLLASGVPAYAQLVINPTFDTTITSDPNAAAIEAVINKAITNFETLYHNNITVSIYFQEGGGLGQSNDIIYNESYTSFYNGLVANNANPAAIAALNANGGNAGTNGGINPLSGGSTIQVTTANGRALGLSTPPGCQVTPTGLGTLNGNIPNNCGSGPGPTVDGIISLNIPITFPPNAVAGNYGLLATVEHEIDEILGSGSALGGCDTTNPSGVCQPGATLTLANDSVFKTGTPEDLFRFSASTGGVRTINVNCTTPGSAFFTYGPSTGAIVQFNNGCNGGDFADFASDPIPPGVNPQVQDAFGVPGDDPLYGLSEIAVLTAIGYNPSVLTAPSISKAFGSPSVPLNGTTSLTFTITNSNTSVLPGVSFTDVFPAGLVVAAIPALTNTCGGTVTATPGSSTVTLSGGDIAQSSSCTISLNVTVTSPGTLTNSVTVSATNPGAGNTSTATLVVVIPPSITKSFGTASLIVTGTTSLSFTVTNPNTTASLTGVSFTDTLPVALVVATPNGLAGSCGGGTITAVAGSGTVSLAGATLPAGTACTFSVNVTAIDDGVQTNTVTPSSANGGTGLPATAGITTFRVPTITKAFGAPNLFTTQSTSLTLTLHSPNTHLTLTGVAFSDTLPTGLVVSTPNGLSTTCSGTVTAVAAGNLISLTGAALSPGQTCTVTVNVTAITAGTWTNITSTLTSTQATPGTPATASIVVFLSLDSPFQVSYAADPSAGESYINIVNTGANGASLLGPGFGTQAGNMCINVYAFAPDEQEISCCSCLLTPNSVANLGVNRDLTSTTLTGVVPTSVVIKLVATLAGTGGAGTSCSATAATEGTLVNGMVAYGTTPQPVGTSFSAAEHTFVPSTLSAAEYASITGRCASILGNGSGFGICASCRAGALGAGKQ